MSMVMEWAKTAFLTGLRGLRGGTLSLKCPDRTYRFGEDDDLDATLVVHDERFFLRALMGSDIGIFPGGELASVGAVLTSLARTTSLSMYHAEDFGTHYARTLHAWRVRFHQSLDRVRALGFDERFIRMWDLYLAYCEAAFLERHAGLFQMLLVKNGSQRTFFNEPWCEARTPPLAEAARESAA